MPLVEKTVFISYRRASVAWALAIFKNLTQHGYDVFFDYSGINSGDFETAILENIEARAHFLVLLTPSALERCARPGDWLRREIETAIAAQRNIVPIMLDGFTFSKPSVARQLKGTLALLKKYNGVTIQPEFFDEAMERLRSKFLNVTLASVAHPPSAAAQSAAAEQQAAANAAPIVATQDLISQPKRITYPFRPLLIVSFLLLASIVILILFRSSVHRSQGYARSEPNPIRIVSKEKGHSAAVAARVPDVISLDPGEPEKQFSSKDWNMEVVTNVTKPSMAVYKPAAGASNGTAVVVCPGGGFMALAIQTEGIEVANWLATKGITTFVLKYRLAHTGEDGAKEFTTVASSIDKAKIKDIIEKTAPLSIADGLTAVAYVRNHASDWGISADRVGIIGFSAGGTVATGVGLRYTPEGRPAFVASMYASASMFKDDPVPADAPPVFLAAASDDQLGLAMDSIHFYEKWIGAHKSAELHIYAKGGHGFGMRKQGFPSDQWIDRFAEWLEAQGWLKR